jgi:hypothetical protein
MVRGVFRVLMILWAGSLWSLLWVAATLFHMQGDRHLAGLIVGRLFQTETYLGFGVAALAMVLPGRTRYYWVYLAVAVLAVNEWLLKPVMSVARSEGTAAGLGFGAWHGVSAALYLVACCAVLRNVWRAGPSLE